MNAQQIQQHLESFHYWDARLLRLDFKYFGDEVTMVFEDSDGNIKIRFSGCYKVCFSSIIEDREKPLREMTRSQIPYFIQDIEITDFIKEERNFLNCKINVPPLNVEICCNSISVFKE